jgi:radical SAM superfamily enzyme YgiQ (UPF0313 family)
LSEVGIRPELSFIAGAPMETDEDFKQTISLINIVRDKYPNATINGVFHYQPYPNSRLGESTIREWSLPLPADLEGWGKYPVTEPRREYFPWLTDRKYSKILLTGQIASYLFLYGRVLNSPESEAMQKSFKWRSLVFLLKAAHVLFVRWSIYLRWNRQWDIFPVEWQIFGYLRNKILKSI